MSIRVGTFLYRRPQDGQGESQSLEWPMLQTATEVRSFHGLENFYLNLIFSPWRPDWRIVWRRNPISSGRRRHRNRLMPWRRQKSCDNKDWSPYWSWSSGKASQRSDSYNYSNVTPHERIKFFDLESSMHSINQIPGNSIRRGPSLYLSL